MRISSGGALRYQQVPSRPGLEGDQNRCSYGVNEVGPSTLLAMMVLTMPREKLYNEGGIMSVTSRILVVDLLSSMYPC